MQLSRWLLAACAVWTATACGDDVSECAFGDPDAPLELAIVYRTLDGESVDVVDGAAVPLIQPPQGGKVLMVGARVRNVDACMVQLTASLRDECTGRIVALEQRPVILADRGDGWGEPADAVRLDDFANVPACPSAAAERDIEGEPYLVKVRVEDGAGRSAEAELTVVPECAEAANEQQCKCECDGAYVLGQACEPEVDGGPPPGTCPADAGP